MGVEFFQAFRPRDGEAGTVSAKIPLRELLSFREPKDAAGAAIRRAQLEALVRLVPATVSSQLVAAGLVALSLRGMVADRSLAIWFSVAFVLCLVRGMRAHRLRTDPEYARRKPARLKAIVFIIALLGSMWLVPPILWFDQVDTEHQMMLGVLVVALMSAGSVSLASVPQAALIYIAILCCGGLVMTSQFQHWPVHMSLMTIFAFGIEFRGHRQWRVASSAMSGPSSSCRSRAS